MISEIAKDYSKNFSDFTPFHKASEREFYNSLPESKKLEIVKAAEGYLGYEYKEIPITVFMEYSRTGNRSHFEAMNFQKRYALNALVLGECVEHKGRFMDDILNGIYSILGESAWFLPAHNSYVRDTPSFPMPDMTDPVLELFSAETGALLSMLAYILSDELEAVSPFIKKAIFSKVKERVYEPYINRHFWWMGNGDEPMNNWTVWCTQNVLLSVFINPDTSVELREKVSTNPSIA